jgi:hypothetical protein
MPYQIWQLPFVSQNAFGSCFQAQAHVTVINSNAATMARRNVLVCSDMTPPQAERRRQVTQRLPHVPQHERRDSPIIDAERDHGIAYSGPLRR